MALFDKPLEELVEYKPEREEPADFDDFWASTLDETRNHSLDAVFEKVDCGIKTVDVFDVTFKGYAGHPIKGWLLHPANAQSPLPCIVEYIGYGGGRGFPFDWLLWSSAGYSHFVMDNRGQGTNWRKGDTPDKVPEEYGLNPQGFGFMTRGILDPKGYFYRRLFTDAVRAVEAARSHPVVDDKRVGISGKSQGGGICVAVSGLVPDLSIVMPDVPFLCGYRRATEITDATPYHELVLYCQIHRDKVDTVFRTLSYFDGINFAPRANADALFSVALMDETCPPSCVYTAYNYYGGNKEIRVYPYNQHEGGESYHTTEKLDFVNKVL